MNKDDNRNFMFFVLTMAVLLIAYQQFIVSPNQKKAHDAAVVAAAASSSAAAVGLPVGNNVMPLDKAIAQSPRIAIDTPSLKGSLALKGALIDDLYLAKYHDTIDPKSPLVELLRPANADHGYYIQSGFKGQNIANMPTNDSLWTVVSGTTLGVGRPVVLGYDNGAGLKFTRTLSIDANYMITEQDSITNTGPAAVSLTPFAAVIRDDMPVGIGKSPYVHEGTMATFSDKIENGVGTHYITKSPKYKDMVKATAPLAGESVGGWYAITDKYWMAAVIPDQKEAVSYKTAATLIGALPIFQAGYFAAPVTVAPGQTWSNQSHIFAGAKLDPMLKGYEKALNIPRFNYAIDWGSLEIITRPIFWLLNILYKYLGNFGLAIMALTVIVKLIFYPLAHKSYESMTKMKQVQTRLQPKLDAIKKRFPDDQAKQQEATMALYQEEKVNPMAGLGGCLPMLLQLPVFWSLYKVLQISIDMRQAPFFGWIKDLSAPDSTTIFNLFGLLPFDPAHIPLVGTFLAGPLHVGIIAIVYGASMWLSQQMTPAAGIDPMQKKMMAFMPLMLTFLMGQVAVGLLIYWVWSNVLSILQQYSIMHRLKVENPIDNFIVKVGSELGKKKAA